MPLNTKESEGFEKVMGTIFEPLVSERSNDILLILENDEELKSRVEQKKNMIIKNRAIKRAQKAKSEVVKEKLEGIFANRINSTSFEAFEPIKIREHAPVFNYDDGIANFNEKYSYSIFNKAYNEKSHKIMNEKDINSKSVEVIVEENLREYKAEKKSLQLAFWWGRIFYEWAGNFFWKIRDFKNWLQ